MANPFFEPLPENGVPRFDLIREHHYAEAFDRGLAEHDREIEAILLNPARPDFANTIEALERAGSLLDRVGDVFWNLVNADASDALQALELAISPRLAAHRSRIYSTPALFQRVQAVVDANETLTPEAQRLLEETHRKFIRAGAHLPAQHRARINEITEALASLTTRFGQNVLKDVSEFELVLDEGADLAGLPEFVRRAARAEAEARGKPGQYVFTISRSSITPFLQYAESRELREKIYRAYTDCGTLTTNNHPVIRELVTLRQERAQLLGFETHADFMLDDRMARTPAAVRGLLDQVWQPCQEKVQREADDLQTRIQADGGNFELQPWDWWYYTEKIRQERFDLDEEEIKPYFRLENVRDGAFEVANKLYGISFTPVQVPLYHPDVQAYEAREADGTRIGLFLFDFFMRPSKQGGAWMSEFRPQQNLDGQVHPVVVNCCNFPRSSPCLLGLDEVRTLFHEFGHGLHGLLSKVRYRSLGGTNVKQDFVELPSQIMEHWAMEPEVLKSYARHIDTGEAIPDELIRRLTAAQTFNQGFATTEYLAACYLDLAWHQQGGKQAGDVDEFESQAMEQIHKIHMVDPRYRSAYFRHIFEGEHYSAGYYVYIWAEVLDADGFEAFREKGIFDQQTAQSFRENILEKGGTVEPMLAYKKFRGREPDVQPLLKKRGML